jgi:DNA-binding protein Fis
MTTVAIRKKLTDYLKVADEKKVKAIYALVADEIDQPMLEYTDELKAELDNRLNEYKKSGKMITAAAAKKQIDQILNA